MIRLLAFVLMIAACKDPKVEAAEKAQKQAKERLDFTQQMANNTNIAAMINRAGMKKGLDTVYMILDTNVTAAKDYYNALYNRAEAKMSK